MSENPDRPREPDCAQKLLRIGAFGFGEFHGQHLLFIPMQIYEALGEEKINKIAAQVYGKADLRQFMGSRAMYRHSFVLELPAKIEPLRKFIAALRNAKRDPQKQDSQPA